MEKNKRYKSNRSLPYFLICLISLFISSCANQVPPSGGPKDIKPPKVLRSIPENYSINFSAHEITIIFDEYIQLKDLNKQLVISPPLLKSPDITIRKKSLVIRIKEDLKANTTYTMNFGQAIADNNEGNVLENFQYVFSTGEILDSLAVQGKVMDAFEHKKEKGILVMLYKENDDSLPFKMRPDYFSRTNDSGQFKISNIAPGGYKIFALKETNNNYKFDSRDESIAFLDHRVTAGRDKNIQLQLFMQKDKQHLTGKYSEAPGKAGLAFNLPVTSLSIIPANDSSRISLIEFSARRDSVILWYLNRDLDSLKLYVRDEQMKVDTVTMRLFKSGSKSLKEKGSQAKLNVSSNIGGEADLDQNLLLTFSNPVNNIDLSQLSFTEDSIPLKNFTILFLDSAKRKLNITHKWKEKTAYSLFIPAGSFTDIFDQKSDTIRLKFITRAATDYGTLALTITVPEQNHHYILQLIDDKENVYRQERFTSDTLFHFENLHPRIYRFKVIDDVNNNGEWDTGNYLQGLQPEHTLYYDSDINVRANWDVETTWNIK